MSKFVHEEQLITTKSKSCTSSDMSPMENLRDSEPERNLKSQSLTITPFFVYVYLRCPREREKLQLSEKPRIYVKNEKLEGKTPLQSLSVQSPCNRASFHDIRVVYVSGKTVAVYLDLRSVLVTCVDTKYITQQQYRQKIYQNQDNNILPIP